MMRRKYLAQVSATLLAVAFLTSCNGFFVAVPLTSITVSPASGFVQVTQTTQFSAIGVNSDNSSRPVSPTWSSSDNTIATINPSSGVATGVANGTATITATVGSVTGTAALLVNNSPPASVVISNCPVGTLLTAGTALSPTLTATATFVNGTTTNVVVWTSSSPSVASVGTTTGLVTGVAAGTANITASLGNVTSTPCLITVM